MIMIQEIFSKNSINLMKVKMTKINLNSTCSINITVIKNQEILNRNLKMILNFKSIYLILNLLQTKFCLALIPNEFCSIIKSSVIK